MAERDLAKVLSDLTPARLRLGRAGAALPTGAALAFQLDHARARDAVNTALKPDGLADALGRDVIVVRSQAADRKEYLRRPDLGRRLREGDEAMLPTDGCDLAIVIADGLSAAAVHGHAASLALAIIERLGDWRIGPVVAAHQARVAIGDSIGEGMKADLVCVLIGERPGLSSPDSLGAYLTWQPRSGRKDSERNCVSNIRPPHGLSYDDAADTIVRLLKAAQVRQMTGVALKDGEGLIGGSEQ
ncbi:ethanolamine ammonia-lyase subunit EutC [Croceicoccus pelagius]|uniref:Ethanolamine ammonia-lyase small subunit n=1 Tax=Croceicoccus pelagius TaxID=1703341 RepID=A0A916Y449_9SPHN|nr:ethanolamine ammonia-lyase subunit EutC [Croceicoccus pelagius]GGD30127.1 ethanolamine ammonia-lyase light chain [Croceicoccus pelagius]